MRPIVLPPNGIPRFYLGGEAIGELRGMPPAGERVPEDWVGSTTTVFGADTLGLSVLPDGGLLRDALATDPIAWLGSDHAAHFGADPALLVKLLDAGERLPVHVHPDGPFARAALGTRYGKTEAWIVIGTSGDDVSVAAGFRDDVDPATLARWVADQDHDALLGALNPLPVQPGDAIFIPAGTPHAIGQGSLIVELQEPTDLSILLEWDGFGIEDEDEATLGLGWKAALGCVELGARDAGAYRGPRTDGPVAPLLPAAADRFFRADRITARPGVPADLPRGFAILVFTEGAGTLSSEGGDPLEVRRGDTVLVPYGAGAYRLEGDAQAISSRPPEPSVNGGTR
jgi:mannose-6-phosphate isomerase